jgi:hypothetical protein
MQDMVVEEEPFQPAWQGGSGDVEQSFTVTLSFHPLSDYPASFGLTWEELVANVKESFVREVSRGIFRQFRCVLARLPQLPYI